MGVTNAMEDVFYDRKDFNYDPLFCRHPLYVTERHVTHHLREDDDGFLERVTDARGRTISSPRTLRNICSYNVVSDPRILRGNCDWRKMAGNIHPFLLSEALLLRETEAIIWLVSTWPTTVLRVYDVIPLEDSLVPDYLTIAGGGKPTLVDCFVLGLLNIKPQCNLKYIDFSGFEKDRKLCRELCRLPILWLRPEARTVDKLHEAVVKTLDITKDKIQRFVNRISNVYSNIDQEYPHENRCRSVTVFVDLQVTLDDVPIGLCLQHLSPYRFSCSRLWMRPIHEAGISIAALPTLLDSKRITHFEYKDRSLPRDPGRLGSILVLLRELRNLFAVSLPCSVDVAADQYMAAKLNTGFRTLKYLQRLNFSYCNLKGELSTLLGGLSQRLVYLCVKDCRLTSEDVRFLQESQLVTTLRELDLSSNDLHDLAPCVTGLMERMCSITCLSLSQSALSHESLCAVARAAKECSKLKVVCLQGYTPQPEVEILDLLRIFSQVPTVQRLAMFPEPYAFPGANEHERELNKLHWLSMSYRYLEVRNREDIDLI